MENTNRIAIWDNYKFILIVCVVVGHFMARFDGESSFARGLILFIYTFHMPAFVFVSGLFSNRAIENKRYDKIYSFLILFLVTKLVLFFSKMLCGSATQFSLFNMNDVSWYAFAVFVYYLATIFLKQFNWKYVMTASIVISLVIGYAKDVGTFLSLSRIITFYPYFLAGYYLKPEKILNVTNRLSVKIAAFLILVTNFMVCYKQENRLFGYLDLLRGKVGYAKIDIIQGNGPLLRAGWYVLGFLVLFAVIAITPSIRCFATTIGSRTLQIYCLHYLIMNLFFGYFNGKQWLQTIWPEHYVVLGGIAACVTVFMLSIKPISVIMNAIIYPKKAEVD